MLQTQNISEVFNTEHYEPFVRFCQSNGMIKMVDLVDCPFDQLASVPGIGHELSMRIKSIVALYRRNHPEEFNLRHKRSAPAAAVPNEALKEKLKDFFSSNQGRLLHMTEISRAVGAKRADILRELSDAPWCRTVDSTSFFFDAKAEAGQNT